MQCCNPEIPDACYVFIHATPGDRVGLITRGMNGFLITRIDQRDMTDGEVKMLVNALNSARGINPHMADRMLKLAISGWRQPACNEERMAA